MDIRITLLCIVSAYGQGPDYSRYYKSEIGLNPVDQREESSNVKVGFVEPLDFASFTQQFFGGSELAVPFTHFAGSESFGAESKKTGVFQPLNSDFSPFSGSPFGEENKANNTGFVQPVRFVSPFGGDAPANPIYKPQEIRKQPSRDQTYKATDIGGDDDEEEVENVPYKPKPSGTPKQVFRHSTKANKNEHHLGKSSYPPPNQAYKSGHKAGASYYPRDYPKRGDVEVFLPKEKAIILPMVNGKPKPYDGYRAASDTDIQSYDGFESQNDRENDDNDSLGKFSEAEIIYGSVKPGVEVARPYPVVHSRIKRSPAEYNGGIYPHYDYSDPKPGPVHTTPVLVNPKPSKIYPKKYQPEVVQTPYVGKSETEKNQDSQSHATEDGNQEYAESEDESEEQKEEKNEKDEKVEEEEEEVAEPVVVPHKYVYDNTFNIPQLKIKTYPYEKIFSKSNKDSKTESSQDEESVYDEYTRDYEKYKKSLPSDLERHFGGSSVDDYEDKYTVAATQNLENNKNCKKMEKTVQPKDTENGRTKRDTSKEAQVCYICSDPKTGVSFEQCAYQSDPKSEKYFYGGASSYKSAEKKKPVTYRYRRSPFDEEFSLEHFIFGDEPEVKRKIRDQVDTLGNYPSKTKTNYRKKYRSSEATKNKPQKYRYKNAPQTYAKIQGAPTTYTDETSRIEGPPQSYNGPTYTYEGPSQPYEGPSQPYEGPKETYEGPAEPYEGPIHQEYYDTTDERLEDDVYHPPKQDYQSTSPSKNKYRSEYHNGKPSKVQSYSVKHNRPSRGPKSEVEEFHGGNFRPSSAYLSDYRFGPEHFNEDEEVEPTKQKEEIRRPSSPDRTGPQKFGSNEARTSASTESEDSEPFIGHVRVYKNGDVCQKKKKDGMVCMVCKNEKTEATYEQCQYSSKPKDKYYTFGSQKSYSSSKSPKSDRHERNVKGDQYPEKSDIVEKKILITKESKVFGDEAELPESLLSAESRAYDRFKEFLLKGDLIGSYSDNSEIQVDNPEEDDSENSNKKNTETVERIEPRDGVEGLDKYLHEDNDKKSTEQGSEQKSYDDYFHELFPEFTKNGEYNTEGKITFDPFENIRNFEQGRPAFVKDFEAESESESEAEEEEDSGKTAEASNEEPLRLKDQGSRIPEEFFEPIEYDHKKDLEKALGEFQNRDWSNCKKIVKNRLTCYQCIDKNGVNNEECMYVEASQPISKHLAYHEKKELHPEKIEGNKEEAESNNNEQAVAPSTNEPNNNTESDRLKRKIAKSKYSRPDVEEVSEDSVESTNGTKGDMEGVQRLNNDGDFATTTLSSPISESKETPKFRIKKNKKSHKKRIKTSENEESASEQVKKKRKHPIKKFSENDDATFSVLTEGTFGQKEATNASDGNSKDSIVRVYFNNTEATPT